MYFFYSSNDSVVIVKICYVILIAPLFFKPLFHIEGRPNQGPTAYNNGYISFSFLNNNNDNKNNYSLERMEMTTFKRFL